MFEFAKLCNECEKLSTVERGALLTAKSVKVLAKLHLLDIPGLDPVETLASFILGSIVADGKVNEQEYLLMYPALVKVFGDDFDFNSIKESFAKDYEGKKAVKDYTKDLMTILNETDESLQEDIVMICLMVVAIDGKVSLKERNYIRRLCRA